LFFGVCLMTEQGGYPARKDPVGQDEIVGYE